MNDIMNLSPDQFMSLFSGAFSKLGGGNIQQTDFQSFYQELSNRIIAYEIQSSWNWIYISSVFILIGLITLILCIAKRDDWDEFICSMLGVISVVVIIAFVIVIGVQLDDISTCHTFPEKVVVEYIKDTLKHLLSAVN